MESPASSSALKNTAPDSAQAWRRLAATMLISTIGGVGMWSVVVSLPAVQADFAAPRSEAALSFTMAMIGFAVGGVVMGRLLDRAGILWSIAVGAIALSLGYLAAAKEHFSQVAANGPDTNEASLSKKYIQQIDSALAQLKTN